MHHIFMASGVYVCFSLMISTAAVVSKDNTAKLPNHLEESGHNKHKLNLLTNTGHGTEDNLVQQPPLPPAISLEEGLVKILHNLSQEVRQLKREVNSMRKHVQKVYLWQKKSDQCFQERKVGSKRDCPSHFTLQRHKSCYMMEAEPINWKVANQRCQAVGAQLVSIESKSEQDYLMDHFTKSSGFKLCDFWTSGTDRQKEGTWMWHGTGQPISYTNWFHSEPNNGRGGEDCLVLDWYFRWRWNDISCSRKKACYICEYSWQ